MGPTLWLSTTNRLFLKTKTIYISEYFIYCMDNITMVSLTITSVIKIRKNNNLPLTHSLQPPEFNIRRSIEMVLSPSHYFISEKNIISRSMRLIKAQCSCVGDDYHHVPVPFKTKKCRDHKCLKFILNSLQNLYICNIRLHPTYY